MERPMGHIYTNLMAISRPARSTSDLFRDIQAVSSNWIHGHFSDLAEFAWQTGCGAFSVSKSNAAPVERYIATQHEHHEQLSFEEEFIKLLERHGI